MAVPVHVLHGCLGNNKQIISWLVLKVMPDELQQFQTFIR